MKRFKAVEILNGKLRLFNRCQLNLKAAEHITCLRKLPPLPFIKEVIVQMHTLQLCEQFLQGERPKFMSYLLDASGGAGIDTPIQIITSPGSISAMPEASVQRTWNQSCVPFWSMTVTNISGSIWKPA